MNRAIAPLLALLTQCAAPSTAPVARPPAPTGGPTQPSPVAATSPGPATAACRDWSTLDLATLPPLPPSRHAVLLDQVWTTVLQKHYDPTIGCLDWPAMRSTYAELVAAAPDDAAAYAAINQMLGELEQSHLGLIPPRREADVDPGEVRPMGRGRAPVVPIVVGDEVLVSATSWHGARAPIPAGASLTAIDGQPVAPLVVDAATRWPARAVERDAQIARAVAARLSCDVDQRRKLTFVPPRGGKPRTRTVPCHVPSLRTASFGNLRDVPIEVESRVLPGTKVGYLRFNIWLMDLLPDVEKGLAELRAAGITSLIVDLRGNPGGVGMMVVPLGRQLLRDAVDLGVMRMRGVEQRFAVKPVTDPFLGPIAILVDGGTASTSEIFAQALVDLGRARVVGPSESQGAALPSLIERLDGGALLQYVVADYTSPGGVAVEGRGVAPHVRVPITRETVVAGTDAVLDAAVADLQRSPAPTSGG